MHPVLNWERETLMTLMFGLYNTPKGAVGTAASLNCLNTHCICVG